RPGAPPRGPLRAPGPRPARAGPRGAALGWRATESWTRVVRQSNRSLEGVKHPEVCLAMTADYAYNPQPVSSGGTYGPKAGRRSRAGPVRPLVPYDHGRAAAEQAVHDWTRARAGAGRARSRPHSDAHAGRAGAEPANDADSDASSALFQFVRPPAGHGQWQTQPVRARVVPGRGR